MYVRLSLTKSKFRDLIYNSKYTLCEIQSDSPGKSIITKEIDTPIDMVVQDILYMDIQDKNAHMNPRKKETRIKYNGKNFFSKDFIRNNNYTSLTKFCSDYKKKSSSFCKGLAWFYEKETRLSVTVPEGVLMPNVKYIIKLDFGEKYKNFKIRFGPEIVKENVDQIMQRNGYKKLANQDELSDYSGKIKMGLKNKLCGDCKHTKNTNNTLENK